MRLMSHVVVMTMFLFLANSVSAGVIVWDQGFETDTAGWSGGGIYGGITQVSSGGGTLSLASATGIGHAEVTQSDYGPYSFFDGSRSVWPGGMTASIDIYLDVIWSAGEGFDYSVAAWGSDGAHQRDFIFHATQDTSTGNLLVGGSNNTSFDPQENLESGNHYVVSASGWYTFEHEFYDVGDGTLAVDLNLLDSSGTLLFTETRNSTLDIIATEIGGNGYAWFTNVDINGGIGVDNHSLSLNSVPEPATAISFAAIVAIAGLGPVLRRRRQGVEAKA